MPIANTEGPPLRIKPRSVILGRVAATGTTNTSQMVRATIRNPTRRLSLMFSVAFETRGAAVNSYASATWTVRARRKNRITGRTAPLHLLQNAIALPAGYELDSAIRELSVEATLKVPTDSGGNAIEGEWVLLCEWEPNQPAMCDDEIDRLFGDCDVSIEGTEALLVP